MPFIIKVAMFLWILLSSILSFAYLAYKLYIKPIRLKAHYSKLFKSLGYRVYEKPYEVHTVPFYDELARDEKEHNNYGHTGVTVLSDNYDVYLSNVLNKPLIFFLSERLISEFLNKQEVCTKITVNYDLVKFIIARGLSFNQREAWKHRRKILSPIFRYQTITFQIPQMVQVAHQILSKFQNQYWSTHPEAMPHRKIQLKLYDLLSNFSSAVVMTGFLGLKSLDEKFKGKPIYAQVLNLTNLCTYHSRDPLVKYLGVNFFKLGLRQADRQILQLNQDINHILMSYISRCREQLKYGQKTTLSPQKSLVELILQDIQRDKTSEGLAMTDQDLVDLIKQFIIGGAETVANYLTILVLNLYQQKHCFQKLRQQINQHIHCDEDINGENLKKVTYLNSVLTETSRMYPMIQFLFQRELREDTLIGGVPISKGTALNYYSKPLLFSRQLFKDPEVFRPERWDEQTEENRRLAQIVSLQFSGGQRSCVGKFLALAEAKVILVAFLRRYQSLVQPGAAKRVIKLEVVGHVQDSSVQLTRSF